MSGYFTASQDGDISTWRSAGFTDSQVEALGAFLRADPSLKYVRAIGPAGRELLIFRGEHPAEDEVGHYMVEPPVLPSSVPGVVQRTTADFRRHAIDQAKASNGLSGRIPSAFGLTVFERWITGELDANDAVSIIRDHYASHALDTSASDMHAVPNKLGLTDSRQLRQFEADVTTIRMAELKIDPV